MEFIQRSIEMKGPLFLIEFIFLLGGILLITSGLKIRKQGTIAAWTSILLGVIVLIISLYLLFWTFIFGFNS